MIDRYNATYYEVIDEPEVHFNVKLSNSIVDYISSCDAVEYIPWDSWAKISNSISCVDDKFADNVEKINYHDFFISISDHIKKEDTNIRSFYSYIDNVIFKYINDNEFVSRNELEASYQSLLQFIRYLPAFYNKEEIKVYIDSKTGFFGVIYKRTKDNLGTLNILVKDNKEVDFSFVKKRTGLITITGTAKFGKSHYNSDQIKSLFRLME